MIAARFVGEISADIVAFAVRLTKVRAADDLFDLIPEEFRRIATPDLKAQRVRRISALGAALPREELMARVACDQAAYFDTASSALRVLQERGVIAADLEVRAFTAWFLGLSVSRILTDIDPFLDADNEWSAFTFKAIVAILTP